MRRWKKGECRSGKWGEGGQGVAEVWGGGLDATYRGFSGGGDLDILCKKSNFLEVQQTVITLL